MLLYTVLCCNFRKFKVYPHKKIDFDHLENMLDYFGEPVRVVDALGLRHLVETE